MSQFDSYSSFKISYEFTALCRIGLQEVRCLCTVVARRLGDDIDVDEFGIDRADFPVMSLSDEKGSHFVYLPLDLTALLADDEDTYAALLDQSRKAADKRLMELRLERWIYCGQVDPRELARGQ